jgi:2',3'-cyclic-nucleotide 2'-phosphodiesterase (5'-nucleotidase family)
MRSLLTAMAIAVAVSSPALAQSPHEEPGSPRAHAPVTILQINDVYETGPVDGVGGLARVATIKKRLSEAGKSPLLMIAGDFLSSSVASTVFKGAQMIAALNAAGLDFATLGNHEFDFGEEVLLERMKEATFQWVVANIVDRRTGKPIGGAEPYVIRTVGGLKVGVIGLCLNTTEIALNRLVNSRLLDPLEVAARHIPEMKRRGAQVIVALTHLAIADDRRLAERFPQIDLIVGGHEHYPITAIVDRTLISKAGSDAQYVARIDLDLRRTGTAPPRQYLERFFELLPVTSAIPDDPETAKVVKEYDERLGPELKVVVGETAVPLDAVSVRLRAAEMPIGNLIADVLRAETGADVALMNSGSIRGDRVYPAGPLTRETLVAMHPFGNTIATIEVPGRVLLTALNAGVSKVPASAGQFPQVSGLTMTVDAAAPPGNRVHNVTIGGRPLDPAKTYMLALPDYVLKGGDEYTMFSNLKVITPAESGPTIVTALEKYLSAHTPISPTIEGRITILPKP